MVPEWEIGKEEFLDRLDCDEEDFEKQLCLPRIHDLKHVIPLRSIVRVESMIPMSRDILLRLVRRVDTLNGLSPFRAARLTPCKISPNHLKVGQKFVYRENYQGLVEELPGLLQKFVISNGYTELGAFFVFGLDADGVLSLACYVPPLLEQHGPTTLIMDGIHRSYVAMQLGTTMNAILIENVLTSFPCGARPWEDVRVISLRDKPADINERYFELEKGLFRDLKHLGIDG